MSGGQPIEHVFVTKAPRTPRVKGYITNRAFVYLVTCDNCGDSELVYGEDLDTCVIRWAEDHRLNGYTP